jgi:hypothetical protein
VYSVPFEFKCQVCGRELTAAGGWRPCALCLGLFCDDHLMSKNSVATCESCVDIREQRELSGPVTAAGEARVVALLRRDVEATIGAGQDEIIVGFAAHQRLHASDPIDYVSAVVEEVQQCFHDNFIDTAWPACPHHPNHPLWFTDGWWQCEQLGKRVAPLGGLAKLARAK